MVRGANIGAAAALNTMQGAPYAGMMTSHHQQANIQQTGNLTHQGPSDLAPMNMALRMKRNARSPDQSLQHTGGAHHIGSSMGGAESDLGGAVGKR